MEIIGRYCIVRTQFAGVFAGVVTARNGSEVEMEQARRLWYWSGAASLSQLAMEGVTDPGNCKFAMPVTAVLLIGVIEVIPTASKAAASIAEVKEWKR